MVEFDIITAFLTGFQPGCQSNNHTLSNHNNSVNNLFLGSADGVSGFLSGQHIKAALLEIFPADGSAVDADAIGAEGVALMGGGGHFLNLY